MATMIGKITSENGSFFIKHPDGSLTSAKVGDVLNEGDIIIGSSSNSNSNLITVALADNSGNVQVVGNNEQLFDMTLLAGEILDDTVVKNGELNESLLQESANNTQVEPEQGSEQATLTLEEIEKLDAAAAGDQPTTDPVGIVPLRLEDRTGDETDITTDLRDSTTTTTIVDEDVDNRPVLAEEAPTPEEPTPEEPTPIDNTASGANLNIAVNETIIYNTKSVVDEEANTNAGIYEKDGKYYKDVEVSGDTSSNKETLNYGNKDSVSFDLKNEAIKLELDVKLTGNENGNGQSQANGKIEFYHNNILVGEVSLVNGTNSYSLDGKLFDSFIITHTGAIGEIGGNGNSNGVSAIHINGYETTKIDSQETDPIMKEVPDLSYEYDISVDASLIDTDGSESLSPITLTINGKEVSDLIFDENGNAKYISDTQIPKDSIQASVTTTESNGGDTETTTVIADSSDGIDTLVLDNNDSIDLSVVDLKSIENIDMTASGSQSVKNLSLSDVMEMVPEKSNIEVGNIGADDHILKINGDNGDSVHLTGDWATNSTANIDSVDYNVYTNSEDATYKVLIQTTITPDIQN